MGDRQKCATHGYVEATEVRAFGGVLVHMLDPWHVALNGDVVEMAGSEPLVQDGRLVIVNDGPQPPMDEEPEDPGCGDG